MGSDLKALTARIAETTGPSKQLDSLIEDALVPANAEISGKNYTSSVDACLQLIEAVLPDWHWHVGHGPTGILPYASLSTTALGGEEDEYRVEADAATVPLALLHVAAKALLLLEPR